MLLLPITWNSCLDIKGMIDCVHSVRGSTHVRLPHSLKCDSVWYIHCSFSVCFRILYFCQESRLPSNIEMFTVVSHL